MCNNGFKVARQTFSILSHFFQYFSNILMNPYNGNVFMVTSIMNTGCTPLLNHSVCCVFRVTNFHGVMCVTTQYAAQSLRCETVLGAADTAQAAAVLWSFGEKGNTRILDILETNLH